MIPSLLEYENFIYSLPEQHPIISRSTLIVKRTSANSAQIMGTIYFDNDITLRVLETVDFIDTEIIDYSYEVRQGSENCGGTIVGLTQKNLIWLPLILIISTSLLISSIIAFLPHTYLSKIQI